jgi:hypothetical protein
LSGLSIGLPASYSSSQFRMKVTAELPEHLVERTAGSVLACPRAAAHASIIVEASYGCTRNGVCCRLLTCEFDRR